eukprot:4909661-Alexandrium_andersonii.AAC.1
MRYGPTRTDALQQLLARQLLYSTMSGAPLFDIYWARQPRQARQAMATAAAELQQQLHEQDQRRAAMRAEFGVQQEQREQREQRRFQRFPDPIPNLPPPGLQRRIDEEPEAEQD